MDAKSAAVAAAAGEFSPATSGHGHHEKESQDELDMKKLGKVQQFNRQFDFWSILGFACVAMITWEGLLITFVFGLENGGPAGLAYGYLFIWLGYAFTIASLAEMMSMWPTSGGQYHWTYTLAPQPWAPFLSYICGWQSLVAWQAITASATYLASTMIQGLAILNHPDTYDAKRWQGTLVMWAVMTLVTFVGIFGTRMIPILDKIALVLHIVGFIAVVAVIGSLSPTHASTDDVWNVWLNNGYPTQGVSFLAGLQGLLFAWLGADGVIHMAEEIKGAARVVPWGLLASVLINGCLGLGILLTVLYFGPTGQDLLDALNSQTGYPFLAIFRYATGSNAATNGLAAIVLTMCALAALMIYTATTRELWALARDKGVPGASILARVDKKSKLPLWCYALTTTVTVLLSLINIGSSIAFNAVISLSLAEYVGSYAFPIALILWRRIMAALGKGPELPWGPWRLGKWGILVNVVSLAWIAILFTFSFFPIAPLPSLTIQTMNWSALAYGAILIFAMGFWFIHGKRTYKGPVRDAAGGEIEPVLGWNQGAQALAR